ncbi:glycosyltransferase family 2 protein [Gloeobacter morelensis]|uniref:Glycosyltransferase n=1 Tax=Gloeobacter morelensis MG652769 TaxID=2781736 RepID=A0ABY3PJ92_9CYAN|nr:glycosyltransferase [Gloeobacter morelensis]UFP93730.1 glycosyltransferase [Gloeobacter morelensis MG652769]
MTIFRQAHFPAAHRPPSSSDEPLVSVLICNYNYGRFVGEAIGSVLEQTYRNIELIVVDDGSTDDSRQVIGAYSDRLRAIFQQNGGQGAAFNSGLAEAHGEIICFLDADDYFHREKVARVVRAFAEHPEWVQLAHNWISVDIDGRPMGRNPVRRFTRGDIRTLLLRWGRYGWGITSGLSYRRVVLERVLPIPKRPRAADTYLTATVPFYGQVGGIADQLMYYRVHGKNRRARSDNLPYLLQQREDTCVCINTAARDSGLAERFDIRCDGDYRGFKALESGGGSWSDAFGICWLSLREFAALRRKPAEALARLAQRLGCVLLPPEQARALLRLGLQGYVRSRLLGAQAPSGKSS